ncbi:tellurite resistance methyltransferase TehB [Erwinia tasmaniensis]|uniref:Protein involved in tellurite resistance n=1 Tax=Erwinia tasmaniensis (strain DSM 17950 / CFBP 7177 / CIP 109463 / NCPPB 4357 / Et1/99) TaxID=465817 RepID=B2VE65_ERWT9|nr:tellurite resistance methyltransferase TehB [Erwinia tasmaniensis]CAO96095.1 protein involved in tellurite resistance [Erwinia tasmaniensis Et1/99]
MTALAAYDLCTKYSLGTPHSELTEALPHIEGTRALDIGCAGGCNSLWLNAQGFDVTAWDNNAARLARLNTIVTAENISGVHSALHDLNGLRFNGAYDLVLSTDVMMFLQPTTVPQLIADMQASTVRDGYNLIVSAMDSRDYPCHESFSFTFRSGELSHYYRKWHIVKYNENVGQRHCTDKNGQPVPLRFATLLARKASVKA